MQLFYSTDIHDNTIILSQEESKHCVQVLRKKAGDTINVIDGNGNLYTGTLQEAHKNKCVIHITEKQSQQPLPYHLHIAMAPPKNRSRFEWFLEKATEIGVHEITPLWTTHSERKSLRTDRGERIILSAAKQCLQAWIPTLNEPISFDNLIEKIVLEDYDVLCIPSCLEIEKIPLSEIVKGKKKILILIGPEGDFSPEEITLATASGFTAVSMGKSRLRTETAGIIACHTPSLVWELNQ